MTAVPDPAETLAIWREQGADRLDPIRFHFIEALSRRAAAQGGPARRVLDRRLAKLLDDYAGALANATGSEAADSAANAPAAGANAAEAATPATELNRSAGAAASPGSCATPAATPAATEATGPLSGLLAEFAARAALPSQDAAQAQAAPAPPAYPELPLLDYFRDVWSRYSTKRQLKQSEERVPENAGPLNSSLLVHRALSLMRAVSPEYLHQFLSYVDALSWMEQATRIDLLTDKEGGKPASGRKNNRGNPR